MNGCPTCYSDDTEHDAPEGCAYWPEQIDQDGEITHDTASTPR